MQADVIRAGVEMLLDAPSDVPGPAGDHQGVDQSAVEGLGVVESQVAQQREPVGEGGGRVSTSQLGRAGAA
ncbi:MAG: hypothetical protein HOV97_31175 [Nonomuraea sp.]|nr:hypothetical protein [Nonomuraea sp.]